MIWGYPYFWKHPCHIYAIWIVKQSYFTNFKGYLNDLPEYTFDYNFPNMEINKSESFLAK